MTRIVPVTTENSYGVEVGRGVSARVVAAVPPEAQRVLIVHTALMARRAQGLKGMLDDAGKMTVLAEIPDAEAGKTAEVAAFCWQVLGRSEFSRSDVVVGLGGGAVTDLAGFVAATWLRGVRVIHVPTTLQAMVDAAVGGKTGINTAEGKNLVGSFHEPIAVLCDLDDVLTQPRNDLVAGLAEVVKAGFIRDVTILDLVEEHMAELTARDQTDVVDPGALGVIEELAIRAIQVKADVVKEDLRESSLREILNYGHTLGHAIEHVERYQWRHGAAVSVGMVFAAELSRLAGLLSEAEVQRHRDILGGLGLPTRYVPGRWDALVSAMRRDKKARASALRFVVLRSVGQPERLEGPDPALLTAAYAAISEG